MNRRTFFRRTVGALATAAIAPRLPVFEPTWYGVDWGAGESVVCICLRRFDRDVYVADFVTV